MITRISQLFRFGEDSASEKEIIESIERGVNFRGAKLWILIIAVFVASLGLNTNSAAVIIGAMLISPLMDPIIGMGLGAGIYDFDLLRRSWRNYIVATLFSVITATFYFLITPLNEARSELLARTSPTIYDVLIALCGGLAGIIALGSKSQRVGNVIPGVAIATALMPPLCTVGFGIATANWAYAAGALYLFIINTIFIAFATLIGAVFIMKFEKKVYIDRAQELKVKRIMYSIVVLTVLPAVILTVGMVHESYFERNITRFINHELHFPYTQVVSHRTDYDNKSFCVVLIGNEVDSLSLSVARERLPFYKLENIEMQVIQNSQNVGLDEFRELIKADNKELANAEAIISQQRVYAVELEQKLHEYTIIDEWAPQLLKELSVLYPKVESITLARGATAMTDSIAGNMIAIVGAGETLGRADQEKISKWLVERTGEQDLQVIIK